MTDTARLLFAGTNGNVRAVDKLTGQDLWTRSLPGTGYDLVTLLHEDGILFAGSKGILFALDPQTGEILWTNNLKGLGNKHLTLATTSQSGSVIEEAAAEDDARSTGNGPSRD